MSSKTQSFASIAESLRVKDCLSITINSEVLLALTVVS